MGVERTLVTCQLIRDTFADGCPGEKEHEEEKKAGEKMRGRWWEGKRKTEKKRKNENNNKNIEKKGKNEAEYRKEIEKDKQKGGKKILRKLGKGEDWVN